MAKKSPVSHVFLSSILNKNPQKIFYEEGN